MPVRHYYCTDLISLLKVDITLGLFLLAFFISSSLDKLHPDDGENKDNSWHHQHFLARVNNVITGTCLQKPYLLNDRVIQGDIGEVFPVEDLGHGEDSWLLLRGMIHKAKCCSLTSVVVLI